MTQNRIDRTFSKLKMEGKHALIPFLTIGFPHYEGTLELVPALVEGGAHIIELGIPFSDPLADGTTIQRASAAALAQGVTPKRCLEVVAALRESGVEAPLILMGYYNPILHYGLEDFCRDMAKAGGDGFIIVDLPPEEAEPMLMECDRWGLDLIFLLAPTSPEERIAKVAKMAKGFIYCVSLTGVTGAREALSEELPLFLERVRRYTSIPLAVGFGISNRSHVEAIAPYCDGVVVGSALINLIEGAPPGEMAQRAKDFIRELAAARVKG